MGTALARIIPSFCPGSEQICLKMARLLYGHDMCSLQGGVCVSVVCDDVGHGMVHPLTMFGFVDT